MLLKIRTVLGEITMSPQQPCYEAFISPKRFRALLGKNFSQKFPKYGLLYFWQSQNQNIKTKQI